MRVFLLIVGLLPFTLLHAERACAGGVSPLATEDGYQYGASPPGLPSWVIISRSADAPPLSIPSFARIDSALEQAGSVKVILRLAPPSPTERAFQSEGLLDDRDAVHRQRVVIDELQTRILARISRKNSFAAKRFQFIPYLAIELDPEDFLAIASSPEVDLIEEDHAVPPLLQQSVPLIGGDISGEFNGFSGGGQTVAILDTGVDTGHPFVAGKVAAEACFSTTYGSSTALCQSGSTAPGSGVNCNTAVDGCSHGTHVAGIAAGDGAGFTGVAKDASLISIQVFSQFPKTECGPGARVPCVMSWISDQISGLQHVYNLRGSFNIASANLSLGGGSYTGYCDSYSSAQKAAIDALRSVGIATVIASGNEGYTSSISAPGCISSAISVGATDKSDVVAHYSNSASILKLLAPGSTIYSSIPGAGYATYDGTSMATPHVAGAWAVLKSAVPSSTVDQVLSALISTGYWITDSRNGLTTPRIKVADAVNALVDSSYLLHVDVDGPGTAHSSTPLSTAGVNCVASCSQLYAPGSNVTLTASPTDGYGFIGWSGACSGTGSCVVAMNQPRAVTASFADITPPDTTFTAVQASPTFSTYLGAFMFSSSEAGSSFECSLNNEPYVACTSPIFELQVYPGRVPTGSNTFRVRAKDAAGNVDPTPVTHTWQVCDIRAGSACYTTVTSAYAASSGGVIDARSLTVTETFNANKGINVTLTGGYTSDTLPDNYTILQGGITVTFGSVTVDRIAIR